MSKKNRPINAFIIDDIQDYVDSLQISARAKRIILKSSTNLETGIEEIKNDKSIDFVILDGKCFVDEDQESTGTTASNIPIRAQKKIDDINRNQNRSIQYCVNTGFYDDLHNSFDGVFEIFKKDDSEKLLNHIINEVSQSENYKLRNKFSDAMSVFDDQIIDIQYEFLLLEILSALENSDYRQKNSKLIRDFLEAIYHGLINIGCIPNTFLNKNDNPNLEWCTRYMEGRQTDDDKQNSYTLTNPIPQEIKSAFRKLKESTSGVSHLGPEDIIKTPFISNTYLLLELLEWLPSFKSQYYSI